METPTLSRIALGALDVNKHLNSPLGSPKKSSPVKRNNFVFSDDGDKERSPVARSLKEQLLLETVEVKVQGLRETPVRVFGPPESRSEKRKEAPTDVEGRVGGGKVARTEGGLGVGGELGGVEAVEMEGDEGLESTQATPVRARTPSASPEVLLEMSQSTTLTSPDTVPNSARESPSPTAQANASDSELRENASALRLRLKFAMYKLKTNQHDIPLSRLELLPPLLKRSSPPARPTTAAADSPSHSEEPGSATPRPQNRQLLDVEALSPSPEKVEMLTPLPRHMQVEAAMGGDEELTSSGVKGRAADGLLSLMGVRE
ncbi:hypothetical protein VF21_09661 [Pseudogymnoascus sp. 05NY08]|nr:hypothetical protein VF21_09661 [Pseudogymnoascus sp. 05NY08]